MNWYYEDNGVSQGPVTETDVRQRIAAGQLPSNVLVWRVGLDSWTSASDLPPAISPAANPEPVEEVATAAPASAPSPKAKRETRVRATPQTAPLIQPAAQTEKPVPKPKKKTSAVAEPPEPQPPDVTATPPKPGFLNRLFGGSKKKKSG